MEAMHARDRDDESANSAPATGGIQTARIPSRIFSWAAHIQAWVTTSGTEIKVRSDLEKKVDINSRGKNGCT